MERKINDGKGKRKKLGEGRWKKRVSWKTWKEEVKEDRRREEDENGRGR